MPSPQKSFQEVLQELWALLRDYAKQETVGPLKNLGRQLGLGLAGSLAVALGVFLLGISILRGLQDHVQLFADHPWAQYLVVTVFYVLAIALIARRLRTPTPTGPAATATPSVEAALEPPAAPRSTP